MAFTEPSPMDFNDHEGYVSLFDGVSLKGWDGNPKFWRVENGAIVGESTPSNPSGNSYIAYRNLEAKDFTLKFGEAMGSLGFDLIDIDGTSEYNAISGYVQFYRNSRAVAQVGYGQFVDPGSIWFDRTVVYGNRSANRIQPMTASKLGISSFDKVVFSMGGSGAIDSITFSPVPEPTAAGLVLGAVGTLSLRRRRSR